MGWSGEDSERRENKTRMATTAVKSRIIKWRGRTRKGSRPSYINREGVSGMSSRPSSCNGFRGVGE